VYQRVGWGRDLVTYRRTEEAFSSSPDEPFAIGARAPRFRNRGSDRDCLVCLTSGADSRLGWLYDNPLWCRTLDAIGSEHWDRTTLCNADTHADRNWAPQIVNDQVPCKQTPDTGPALRRKKTDWEEEKKTLQRIFSKKTESEEDGGIIHREIRTKSSPRTTAFGNRARYPVGDSPTTFLNTRLKWVSD
jgi:hypothetical protein